MIIAITQARLSSSRLPEKILKPLGDDSVLGLHLKRIKKSRLIDRILVATTHENGAEKISAIAKANQVDVSFGSLEDVLDRFYQAAKPYKPDYVVRLTSDCPLIDASLVDELITKFLEKRVDYGSNCLIASYPDGFDAEVFTFSSLEKAWKEANLKSDREHVTPYIWRNSDIKKGEIFRAFNLSSPKDFSHYRLTLDNQEDYQLLTTIVERLGTNKSWKEYTQYIVEHPELLEMNQHLKRNAGYDKSLKED